MSRRVAPVIRSPTQPLKKLNDAGEVTGKIEIPKREESEREASFKLVKTDAPIETKLPQKLIEKTTVRTSEPVVTPIKRVAPTVTKIEPAVTPVQQPRAATPPPQEPEPIKDIEQEEKDDSQPDDEPDDLDEKAQEAITAFGQAQKLNQQKDYKRAIEQYDIAVVATSNIAALREIHAKSLFMRGQAKKQNNELTKAIDDFNLAIKHGQHEERINIYQYYNVRGNTYNLMGKLDDAIKDYNKVIQLLENSSEKLVLFGVYHNRGLANLDTKRCTPAIDDFTKALTYLSDDELIEKGIDTWYQLARAYHLKNELDNAIQYYTRVSRIDASFKMASYHLGHLLYDKGDHEQALESFSRSIDKEPNDYISLFNRGMCNKYLSNFDEALEDFEKAVQENPTFAKSNVELAKAYQQRDGEKADFNRILDLYDTARANMDGLTDEESAQILFERGIVLNKLGKFEAAADSFSLAVCIDDSFVDALFNRGQIYGHELHKYEEALGDFDTVLNLNPNDVDALIERGILFLRTDNVAMAQKDLDRILKIDSSNAKAKQLNDYIQELSNPTNE
jgi:tetratricopeptide (TPR) repeat protein